MQSMYPEHRKLIGRNHGEAARLHMSAFLFLLLPICVRGALPVQEPATAPNQADTSPSESAAAQPTFVIASGQITDAIGAGQKDVLVTAFLKNADGSAGRQIAQTKTDTMGDFSLPAGEPPGNVEIVVKFSKDQFTELSRIIQLEEGRPPPFLGEALEGNLSLTGKVISAADKKPVAARVVFENMFSHREVETNADGQFEIRSLSPVQGELEVTSAGFGRERKAVRVPVSGELIIELKPQRTVHLTVTDRAGTPIAGAVLECIDSARHDFRTLITGDDGTAVLSGLHFDAATIVVRLTREGYVASQEVGESLSLPGEASESRHTLIMERAGTISGQVRDAKNQSPLYGARVFAGESYTDYAPREWTNPEGKYLLTGVRPGTTTVTVHLAGHAPEMKTVETAPGETARLNFDLGEAGAVRGVVKSKSGEPVAGIEVAATQWRDKETLGLRAMTDKEGRFVIENAPADEFSLSVFGSPTPVTRTVKTNGGTDVEFVLDQSPPPRIQLSPGQPAPDLTVKSLGGESISLRELRGKTVLLVFWATWCGPCVAETPRLIEVNEKFRGRNDFVLLGVSRDFEESSLRDFLKANPKMTWPQAFGEAGGAARAAEAFGVTGIPAIFLLDSEGKVAAVDLRDERIMQEIQKALGGKPTP
jgi:peroxiredoxin